MNIHLIRHGETLTSGKTYAGRSDVALSDCGVDQAKGIARNLSRCPIALILTSPLSRAVGTALPLARELALDPVREPALVEIDFGAFEGLRKGELGLKLRKHHARNPLPGGESLWDVWVRAGQVIKTIRTTEVPPMFEIALVGHFWVNRLVFGRATGMTFDEACRSRDYRPATGSVVQFRM